MANESAPDRVAYVFNQSPEDTDKLWKLLLSVVRPQASAVVIDGYPSPDWEDFSRLPEPARSAHEVLAQLARLQDRKPGEFGALDLNPRDQSQWEALREFGSHSINVEVCATGDDEDQILNNHDSGSLGVRLSAVELRSLTLAADQVGIRVDDIIEEWHPKPSLWKRLRNRGEQEGS